jgi:hypothetical protein
MGNFGDDGIIPTAWAVNFVDPYDAGQPMFMQNLGAFGGGSLTVEADGNIDRLSVVVPTTGRPDGQYSGSFNPDAGNSNNGFITDEVTVLGKGGALNVTAGGDIKGGVFYLDGGVGKIKAGNSLRVDGTNSINDMAPVLAVGDARLEVQARTDLTIETVLNPTMLPSSDRQLEISGELMTNSYFFTYGEDSGVGLTSLAEDVVLRNNQWGVLTKNTKFPHLNFNSDHTKVVTVYPGDLSVAALQGNIFIDNSFTLFPSPHGDLSLLAEGDITTRGHDSIRVNMSDTDPASLPKTGAGVSSLSDAVLRLSHGGSNLIHAATPVHSGDDQPVIIVARNGSLYGSNSTSSKLEFYMPKQARLVVGGDIRNILFSGQNLAATDLTQLKAGRDIVYIPETNVDGKPLPNKFLGVTLAGPGELELIAGRNIDLGTSKGVTTNGNTVNPALAENGANITVEAGISQELDFTAYLTYYAQLAEDSRSKIATAVRRVTDKPDLSVDEALAALASLPRDSQRQIALTHFYGELKQSALEAAKGEAAGYQRGYDAIAALFGEKSNQGDVRLYFSRIHTEDNGDINMLVPGGLINAGLAVVKGLDKKPDELGIVAQRAGDVNIYLDKDMLVNQSRVFALDGGDIVIWSQHGNIDAGRGAKSAISAPPPKQTTDDEGNVIVEFPAAIAGSGIRTAASSPDTEPGGVTLAAPQGAVIANDAGIESAGRLTLAATEVLGADNISAGGETAGVPNIEPPSVSAEVGNAGNAASAGHGDQDLAAAASTTPLADSALAFLEVEVLGFGAVPVTDVAAVTEDDQKVREQEKGAPLARDSNDVLPKTADSAKPAGRVAVTPTE